MIVGGEDVNLCLRPFLYPSPGRGLISQHRLYEAQRDGGGSYPQPALTLGWVTHSGAPAELTLPL